MAFCDDRIKACCIHGSDTFKRHESDAVNAEDNAPVTHESIVAASQADTVGCKASHCHDPPTLQIHTAASIGANAADNSIGAAARRAVAHGSRLLGRSCIVRRASATSTNTSTNTSKSHKSMRSRSCSWPVETADTIGSNTGGECPFPQDSLPGKLQQNPLKHRPLGSFSGRCIETATAGTSGSAAWSNRSRGSRFKSSIGGGGGNSTPSVTPSPTPQSRGGQLAASVNNPHTIASAQSARDSPDSSTVPKIQTASNTPSSRTRSAAKCKQSARSHSVPQRSRLEQRLLAAATEDVSRQGIGLSSRENRQPLHGQAPSALVPSPPPTRQSHHSPGTAQAVARQNIPAVPSSKCKTLLLNFLRGTGVDVHGRRFEDIMEWDFRRLERSHDYIQWLFPTDEPSRFNVRALLLTPDLVISIRKDPAVVAAIRRAFSKFCNFLGFELVLLDTKVQNAEQPRMLIRQAPHFHERFADCWEVGFTGIGFNHNWLRISRVLHCLRLVGLGEEAAAFLACLERMPGLGIRCGGALVHWRKRACTEVEVATSEGTNRDPSSC